MTDSCQPCHECNDSAVVGPPLCDCANARKLALLLTVQHSSRLLRVPLRSSHPSCTRQQRSDGIHGVTVRFHALSQQIANPTNNRIRLWSSRRLLCHRPPAPWGLEVALLGSLFLAVTQGVTVGAIAPLAARAFVTELFIAIRKARSTVRTAPAALRGRLAAVVAPSFLRPCRCGSWAGGRRP
jgi:hypothetical protein